MNLFQTLFAKPARWIASSIKGKQGRDIVDKYSPLVEEAAVLFLPQLSADSASTAKGIISDWAIAKGVPEGDAKKLADVVLARKF
jgi:hypothetical protein